MVTPAGSSPVSPSPPVLSASSVPAWSLPGETQRTGFVPNAHVRGRKAVAPRERAPLPEPCSPAAQRYPLRSAARAHSATAPLRGGTFALPAPAPPSPCAPHHPAPSRPRRDDLGPSIPRRERPDPPPATRRAPSGPAAGHLRLRWAPPPRGPETKATRPLRRRLLQEPRLPGTQRRMGGGGGEMERRERRGRGPGVGPLRRRPPGCRGPDPSHHPRPASLQGSVLPRPQPENLPRGTWVPPLGGRG